MPPFIYAPLSLSACFIFPPSVHFCAFLLPTLPSSVSILRSLPLAWCLGLITREHVGSVLVSPRGRTALMTGFMHWGKARGLTDAVMWERARSAETGLHRPSLLPCQRQLCPPGTLCFSSFYTLSLRPVLPCFICLTQEV